MKEKLEFFSGLLDIFKYIHLHKAQHNALEVPQKKTEIHDHI